MKKRLLALLLAGALTMTMVPVGVVAEGETAPTEIIMEETVPAVEETLPEATESATEAATEAVTEPAKPGIIEAIASVLNAEDPHKTRDGYTKYGHGDDSVTWIPVTKASEMPKTTGGHYYLEEDINVGAMIDLTANVDITLCLNGHTLTGTNRIYKLNADGAKLTICDCTAHTDASGNHIAGKLIPGVAEGGAIGLYKAATFTMEDVIIDGTGVNNTATSGGGAIIITSGGIVNINSGVIKNCTAQRGGAIYVYKGTLNISGGTISGNTSRTTGGAISTRDNANDNGSAISITGGTFTNNTANHGGAMFLCNVKSVLLQDVTITGNRANNRGGGVDNQTTSGQSLLTVGGKTVITDNYVGKALQNLNNVNGGRTVAISAAVPLTEGARIGISTRDGQVAATNLAISAATAQADAHKYFTSDMGHEMTLVNGKVTITGRAHNPGEYKPGHQGVTDWKGTATLPATTGHYYLTSDLYLTSAVAVSSEQNIVLCLNGYDIIQTGATRIYRLSDGANVSICDCTSHKDADGNYVAGKLIPGTVEGGAIGVYHDNLNTKAPSFTLYDGILDATGVSGNVGTALRMKFGGNITIAGGVIRGCNNTAVAIDAGTLTVSGGRITGCTHQAILVGGGTANMTGGIITGITYSANSGAITVKGGTFNLSGGEISGNNARGILVDGGTVNLSGAGKVNNNTFSAADCSGIRVNSGKLVMTGGEISGNNSGGSSGAGVTARGGEVTLSGGTISGNTAANGAAVLVAGAAVTLSGVNVTGNTATGNGVVRIDSGSLKIQEGTQITGNTANGTRGVVYVNAGTVVMTGGTISANTGHQDGGAVVLYGGSFAMSGGEISNHSALRGVLVNGGSFSLSGTGKVCNNTFTVTEGAGIRVEKGSFSMSGGEISGNDSGTNKGGALRLKDGTVNITGGKIINNKAKDGAGIIVAGATVNITNTEISGNQAVTSAGGVYVVSGSLNLGEGTVISGNCANYGAGVHISGGNVAVRGASITGNTAGKRGAGIDYASSGTLTVGGKSVISGNKLGSIDNNLMLVNGRSFILEPLTEGAKVGVSAELSLVFETGKLLLANNATQDDLLDFVSYDTKITHSMKVQGDKLYIIQDPNTKHEPHAQDECGHQSVTWKAWSDVASMPVTSGHYYLTCDVNVASMAQMITAEEVTVCLNGFTVTGNNRVYRLSNGAKLNICDCTAHTDKNGNYVSGKLIPGTSKGGVVGLYKDAETDAVPEFTFYAGIIDGTGVTNEASGMAIRMEDHGIVNIIDGVLRGCTNPEGVITIRGGELNISGGKITENNARAVLVQSGIFNFSGGEISNNTFTKTEGVGVRLQDGVFHMTGGIICGNDAGEAGTAAAIRVSGGKATLSGGEICHNIAFKAPGMLIGGGEVIIEKDVKFTDNDSHSPDSGTIHQVLGTATMTGGEISGNKVRGWYISGGEDIFFTMSGGAIKNNQSKGRDGAGMRLNGGNFTMTGGEISGNDAGESSVGGIRVDKGVVKLLGGKITGNMAKSIGGLGVIGGEVYTENIEISGHTVTGNGGAVYQNGGKLTLGKGTILTGNNAGWNGGGVFSNGGDLTIDGATITKNTAANRGGGVDFGSEGMLTINGAAKITDNKVAEKTSNLVMPLGNPFVTDGLDTGCKIGFVTNLEALFADGKQLLGKGVTKDELAYFTYDEEVTHTMEVLEDGLYMIQDPETIHKSHEKDECGHKDVVWTAWTDMASLPKTAGHYYLVGDVELKSTVAVGAAEEITLCLNGFDVTQTGEGMRIYRLSGGAKLNLCDCTAHTDSKGNYIAGKLTGGNTDVNAGAAAIYAAEEGTAITLYSGKISGNKTEGSGAIVAFKKAAFKMYGGEISDNVAGGNGAGVYINDAHADLLGGVIKNNKAQGEGGGVYCAGATAKLDGTKILNNRAESAAGGFMVAREAKVEFISGEIYGNQAKNGGGVILQSKGYMNMTGGRINGNKSFNGNGGGVYISHEGTFNLRGGSVNGNTSKKVGGGIYTCDQLNIYGGSVSGNHSEKEGGGVYITESVRKDADGNVIYSDGVLNMYGGTISGNTTSVSAAGVLVRGQRGTFNLRGGSVTGNKALSEKDGGHGGGIIVQGKGHFNMYGGSITDNVAHNTSGGIGSYSDSTVKLYGGTISGNKAYRGAGVYLAGKEAIIDGVTITKNIADFEGAGVYVSATKLTMDSGVISENETPKGNGAGIVLRTEAQMIFNDGQIIGNKASEGHAGGILIQSSATLLMNGGEIAENFASLSGGGIRSSHCKVEILGGVIRDNVTDMSGAGIYGENTLIMKNCTVSGNRVTGNKGGTSGGAGIYLAQQTQYTLENVIVKDNYAIGKAGGMQIGYRCIGTITGCTFTKNTASANGAGIVVYIMGELDMKDTVVEANTAVGNGGGIYVESDTPIKVTNCAINKNSAKEGGALYIGAKGMADMTDTEIRDNSALVNGGAIYANGSVYLTDCKITGSANKAESAAVVLDNAGIDGESYIPGVNQFKGNVIISDNLNNNLRLINGAFVNIHGDGLGDQAEILVYQPEGGITNSIIGPYHYVRSGDEYTITKGETSLNTFDPETPVEGEATEPVEGEDSSDVSDGNDKNIVLIAVGGVFALAVILGGVAVAVVRKGKKAKKNS